MIDLVASAPGVWLDHVVDWIATKGAVSHLLALSIVLIVMGVLVVVGATGELAGEITEIYGHWWSTAATFPLFAGVLLAFLSWRAANAHEHVIENQPVPAPPTCRQWVRETGQTVTR